ncbi:unnamed protein product [Miscanthus lutarioriparius]|uniref:Pectinesterase inhibitor domain-containing protein n=1 Tax=Miscanthus lutarioriparius TaxID=422564 RepID=A0A811PAB2_9POAL|nr:unnamed protein product [Miscanthus lutarioriparius]
MFRYLTALILVAALAASMNKFVDARVVHPIVSPDLEATGPSPADDDDGHRLIGTTGHDELVALCQQMHYQTLCTTMTTLPRVTTPEQLLDASLWITAVKEAMAETKLDQAIKSGGAQGNPMMPLLETCKESYASLVDSINTSWDTLKSGGSNTDLMSGVVRGGHILHRLRGHLRGAAGAPIAHTQGSMPYQPRR